MPKLLALDAGHQVLVANLRKNFGDWKILEFFLLFLCVVCVGAILDANFIV